MRVDFYQLDGEGVRAGVLAAIAGKLTADGERLLVVAEDEALLASLNRQLWEEGGKGSFLAHGIVDEGDDQRQPILLSTRTVAANRARHIALADGVWRAAALNFDRAFFIFDPETIDAARTAWKDLASDDGVERHYWAREDGKWVERG
ncbi:DNA polymerase III subunit chi [Sphingomicrobium marinum]|uniref:DNA polymerase III subunit chi n=1 Tax=Sphingomicrobium marinum TaxID=1227950 RepID=UPI0022402384|nr:DNA polymerase III subunit chi [Sphingomicrobium marinum]